MAKLDSLIVDLQLNSASLRSGLDAAKSALGSFGATVKGVGEQLRSLTQMQGFQVGKEAIAGLSRFVQAGADAADQMGKMAQAAGTSVESFSRLDYAGGLAGLSTEQLGGAFSKLNKNLAAAAAGSRESMAIFTSLGVRVTDSSGKVRDSADVMSDLARQFANLQDGASKSAMAMEVFGKSGAEMIPFLNQGAEGLAALGEEADKFGITISGQTARAAEEFNDNMEKLERVFKGVAAQVAGQLAPMLTRLTNELLGSKEGVDALKGAVIVLTGFLKGLVSGGVIIGALFEAVGKTIARVASAIADAAKGNFDAILGDGTDWAKEMVGVAEGLADRLKGIWDDGTGFEEAAKKDEAAAKKSADGIRRRFEQLKNDKGGGTAATMTFDPMDVTARFGDADHDRMVADYQARQEVELFKRLQVENSFTGQLQKQLDAFGAAFRGQLDNLLSKMGTGGALMQAGIEGMASGGPWGALLAIIVELVSRMSSFTKMIDFFNESMGRDIEQLGNALSPLFEMMQTVSEVVHGLFGAFGADVMTVIKFALLALAKTVAAVALGFVELAKFFSDLGGNHDKGLLNLRDKLNKVINEPFEAVKVPAEELGDQLEKTAEKLEEFRENLPTGYKLRGAQFAADVGLGGGTGGGGGGGAAPVGMVTAEADQYGTASILNQDYSGQYSNTVKQGQFSESTRSEPYTPPPEAYTEGSPEWFNALPQADKQLWIGLFNQALSFGLTENQARVWATDQFKAKKHQMASSSSAATAAGGGGGGASVAGGGGGAFNINGGNVTPQASVGAAGGDGGGGGMVQQISIGTLNLYGVQSLFDLWNQLQELGRRERAGSSRSGDFAL